jgi:hypothetical protein
VTALAVAGAVLAVDGVSSAAHADTAPPSGTPATVSADALPTVQVDGIVWSEAVHGNTVYATGRFTAARPAGVPVGGAGSVTRTNILAFDIRTGLLVNSFVHSLSGGTRPEGRAIAVSHDGKRLYVGGTFTRADGQPHSNFAAFDLTTNRVLAGNAGPNRTVLAVAATDQRAYVGGSFTSAGGHVRKMVAAYDTRGRLLTTWVANVAGASGSHVSALVAASSVGNLVIGGSFNTINGKRYYSTGAVKLSTGIDVTPWASQSPTYPIRMQPPAGRSGSGLGITTLRADGSRVYLGAFTAIPGRRPGTFEGTAAIRPTDGRIIFIDDCVGDTYGVFPVGQVLYSVGHPHSCAPIGGYPQLRNHWQRALAETAYATGKDGPGVGSNYPSYQGQPSSTLLNWFPDLATANVSGSHQAAWSVVGTSQYVALGGEFPSVNGAPQQGLVRFAVAAEAPNKIGPSAYVGAGYGVVAAPADSTGKSAVRVFNVGDRDNGVLTYQVYRRTGTQLLATTTLDSRFWRADSWTFTDSGLTPGFSADYRVVATDPFGNSRSMSGVAAVDDMDNRVAYVGTWSSSQHRADSLPDLARDIHYTKTDGDSYRFSFYGKEFRLIGEKAASRGAATVEIDGGPPVPFTAYSLPTLFQQVLYPSPALALGRHTIVVTKKGGTYMDLDAIRVTQDNVYDDAGPDVSYSDLSGSWTSRQDTDSNDIGGGIHYTATDAASATVAFTGSSVALIAEVGPDGGTAAVSVDGGAPTTVDESNPDGPAYQRVVFTQTGLTPGAHTLSMTKVSGASVDIDGVVSR